MRAVINLMESPVVVASGVTKTQPAEQAMDVGGFDQIDLAIDTPGYAPDNVKILTSMTLYANDADWVVAASTTSGAISSNAANFHLAVPDAGKPLFRFIRYQILNTGANIAAVRITGMARNS